MLLGLDKSCDDFVDVVDARGLANGFEGFLNDLGVAHVLVEQALLFNVLGSHRVEADHQDFDGVSELLLAPLRLVVLHGATQTLVIELHFLIFLFQLLLQEFDVGLKSLLSFFVLALESEDLIIGLAGLPSVVESFLVGSSRLVLELLNALFHLSDALLGEEKLVAHAVDPHLETFVVTLDIVQEDFLVLELVL